MYYIEETDTEVIEYEVEIDKEKLLKLREKIIDECSAIEHKKINQVEQPYRNILELRFVKGMKVEEISVELDRDYRYTKKLIKKSIKKYAEI